MITAEPKCKQYIEHLELANHVKAAIKGKPGAIELIRHDSYYGLVTPNYRITVANAEKGISSNAMEIEQRKRSYFGRGRFFNATGVTHDKYLGMIGSKECEYYLPPAIEVMANDVDGMGTTLHDAGMAMASELLVTARGGALSNPPNLVGQSDGAAKDMMPTIISYESEDILWSMVDKGKLCEVHLAEDYWYKIDTYEWQVRRQVRRLFLNEKDNYACEVWRDGKIYEVEQEAVVDSKPLKYIPFQFYGSEANNASFDRPVMFDLAHQNLGHFQLDCENRENLFYHAQGVTNIFTNLDNDEMGTLNPGGFGVGAKDKNILGQDDRVEILQIEATGALPSEMLRDEQRMIMLGAQVVMDKASSQTATGAVIESNASSSQLKRLSNNDSAGLTQNLKWCAEFKGVPQSEIDKIYVKMNTKFATDELTAQDLQAVFAGVQGSYLPKEVYREAVRKAGVTDKTDEEMDKLIEGDMEGESQAIAELRLAMEQLQAQISANNGED